MNKNHIPELNHASVGMWVRSCIPIVTKPDISAWTNNAVIEKCLGHLIYQCSEILQATF